MATISFIEEVLELESGLSDAFHSIIQLLIIWTVTKKRAISYFRRSRTPPALSPQIPKKRHQNLTFLNHHHLEKFLVEVLQFKCHLQSTPARTNSVHEMVRV